MICGLDLREEAANTRATTIKHFCGFNTSKESILFSQNSEYSTFLLYPMALPSVSAPPWWLQPGILYRDHHGEIIQLCHLDDRIPNLKSK